MNQPSRVIKLGPLMMGGSWPVLVQTMWKDPLPAGLVPGDERMPAILSRIENLKTLGCDVIRFAVPDEESARSLGAIAGQSPIPVVADIHFDWRLALLCLDYPVAKIRINPGNIGERWKVEEIVGKAKDKGVPLRIGVNGGSLPLDLRDAVDKGAMTEIVAAVAAAEREIAILEELDFSNIAVSIKLNEPNQVVEANRIFASRHDYPLHLGVTEAGPLVSGVVRNTAALVPLLKEGIGATLRVSLSAPMESELMAAREILGCVDAGTMRARIVSCPRCGRASFDTHAFLDRWEAKLYSISESLTVAIMGCVVNGPGEARNADIGITGAGNSALIFRHGEIVRTIQREEADLAFEEELNRLLVERRS
ncbi:MAG: flavodoxin-dependent (E)-4-hydroxy-3-methylbut-2-enyl-diphosphate synthase [Spirochaetaceae bacterium]|nr:flavodoxin-dependent (E)-4-hydroxy-3-methylbut-2-enyl-diphosphate synthase [Spirochaetaceae bacterium]